LAKYETWEDAPLSLIDLLSLNSRHTFRDIKTQGVGQTTILKFLGKNWRSMRHGKNALIFLLRHYLQEQREILYMLKPKE
jgi:hypothetical protein